MLDEAFLSRMRAAFPSFYERLHEEARADAARLREHAGGDVEKALVRARFTGAGEVWWPYVKGSVPLVGNDHAAMEGFTRLVLTVDHLVGWEPPTMEAARDHVTEVLRRSVDVERLKRVLRRDTRAAGETTAASAGVVASIGALWAPVATYRRFRGAIRLIPPPLRIGLAAVAVGALASIPVVAAYSAGRQAERSAREAVGQPTFDVRSSNGVGRHVAM